jgi:hypothetical protein
LTPKNETSIQSTIKDNEKTDTKSLKNKTTESTITKNFDVNILNNNQESKSKDDTIRELTTNNKEKGDTKNMEHKKANSKDNTNIDMKTLSENEEKTWKEVQNINCQSYDEPYCLDLDECEALANSKSALLYRHKYDIENEQHNCSICIHNFELFEFHPFKGLKTKIEEVEAYKYKHYIEISDSIESYKEFSKFPKYFTHPISSAFFGTFSCGDNNRRSHCYLIGIIKKPDEEYENYKFQVFEGIVDFYYYYKENSPRLYLISVYTADYKPSISGVHILEYMKNIHNALEDSGTKKNVILTLTDISNIKILSMLFDGLSFYQKHGFQYIDNTKLNDLEITSTKFEEKCRTRDSEGQIQLLENLKDKAINIKSLEECMIQHDDHTSSKDVLAAIQVDLIKIFLSKITGKASVTVKDLWNISAEIRRKEIDVLFPKSYQLSDHSDVRNNERYAKMYFPKILGECIVELKKQEISKEQLTCIEEVRISGFMVWKK